MPANTVKTKFIPCKNVEDRELTINIFYLQFAYIFLGNTLGWLLSVIKLSTLFYIFPGVRPIFSYVISSPGCDKNVSIFL